MQHAFIHLSQIDRIIRPSHAPGYRLGHLERYLPKSLKQRLGMFSTYWT